MDDKLKLSYVISAVGMMGIFAPSGEEPWFPEYANTAKSLMNDLNKHIDLTCKNSLPNVSMLYNAYTEEGFIPRFKTFDNFNAKSLYADSGGLQIVTAGRQVSPEIKMDVYKKQAIADYAMCFDEIPLISVTKVRTRNERSNTRNKVFIEDNMIESALATGRNIKEQTTYFRTSKSNLY